MMVMYDCRCCLQNFIHTSNMKVCYAILEVNLSKKEIKYVVNQHHCYKCNKYVSSEFLKAIIVYLESLQIL